MDARVLSDADSCRRLLRLVLAASADGEVAEDEMASSARLDGRGGDPATSTVDAARQWWRRWSALGAPVPAGQARKNRQVTVSFAERLGELPERVAIAGVGECDVVHHETIEVLPSWRDRAADRHEVVGVHHEVRRAMADLTATRMRLQLAIGRLDDA